MYPAVVVDSNIGYCLGWHIEEYHGSAVYYQPDGTAGFATELVVTPERRVGFALLANQLDQVFPIGRMATYRLLEMMTGQEQVYDQEIREYARGIRWQVWSHKGPFVISEITRKCFSVHVWSPSFPG